VEEISIGIAIFPYRQGLFIPPDPGGAKNAQLAEVDAAWICMLRMVALGKLVLSELLLLNHVAPRGNIIFPVNGFKMFGILQEECCPVGCRVTMSGNKNLGMWAACTFAALSAP